MYVYIHISCAFYKPRYSEPDIFAVAFSQARNSRVLCGKKGKKKKEENRRPLAFACKRATWKKKQRRRKGNLLSTREHTLKNFQRNSRGC